MVRDLGDATVYLIARLPRQSRPDWLPRAIAEVLFWNPEYRLVEECDLVSGKEVVEVHFHEDSVVPQYDVSKWGDCYRLAEVPVTKVNGSSRRYLAWYGHSGDRCFGPVSDMLLLDGAWPAYFTEMPPQVLLIKAADPERTLMEQLRELRAKVVV